jgi:hypothetical protein
VIAEFTDYDQLITALRDRAAELSLSGETIDAVSGLTSRYSAKLLGKQQIRRLGATSLGPFLGALAVRGVLVEDKAAVERLRSRTTPRRNEYVRSAPSIVFTVRFFNGSAARARRRASITRPQSSVASGRRKPRARAGRKLTHERQEAPPVLSADGQAPLRRRAPRPGAQAGH